MRKKGKKKIMRETTRRRPIRTSWNWGKTSGSNLIKQVSIPVFNADKKSYQSWKAVFMTYIDKAPATAEYKLLQLRKYLKGEALKVV